MRFIKNITPVLLFVFIISFHQRCTQTTFGQRADSLFLVDQNLAYTYNLKQFDEKHFLPYVLEEISGLGLRTPTTVLAIDDESGKVFEYDLEKRAIVHSIEFYKTDDYEGVELAGDDVYVLKHDGDLFQFPYSAEKQAESIKYETALKKDNDTEGLGYDQARNRLLIACKEEGSITEEKIFGRAFYAYDITTKTLSAEPIFIVGPKELQAFWESVKERDYEIERIKFKPSAIATHPLTGDYYILSSVGKLLIVVEPSGSIKGTYPLSPRILGQPEGLCFDPSGDMYISSEGEGDRGYILKFEMKKTGS